MSQYLLSVIHDGEDLAAMDAMSPDELQAVFAAVDSFNAKLQAEGAWVFAGGLQTHEATTTVDATGAEVLVTDGPFAESKEYLGGFWIIEAPDLDAALRWAAEGSKACANRVEVRPFQEEPSQEKQGA
ncbi:YciI family protein [Nocardioides sp.]|uniref:YciI family protein n=1 Tax=Nocardioides sp. TaxID=35761 RepID=UPI0025D7D84C|nr:YciI family protein [Nocardioides sp.]